jgi:glycosyltransferase involved in cell wall biosynthesis
MKRMKDKYRIRVLMIGPGEGIIGGISSLIETILPVLEDKVDLQYFYTVRYRSIKESGRLSFKNLILAIFQYARFLFALYRFNPHIIHLHTSQGVAWLKDTFYVLVGKTLRYQVVLHVHAADFNELYGKKSRLTKYYSRKVMGLADTVIAVSEEWRIRLMELVHGDKIITFRNCINVDATPPSEPIRRKNGVRGLFLGSIGSRKGAFDLLHAMGSLKNTSLQLWIAGYEERKGDMKRARDQIEEMQLEGLCELVGTVQGSKKTELLRKSSLFVLPSYDEGLPIAVLEAMGAGLAIVSTPVGGIPEVVKDGYNGFLINPGDVKVLAEKLMILSSDPTLREIMGKRSREIAEHKLDVKPYVQKLVALYKSL